jgi:predicted HTH domain antitoxin
MPGITIALSEDVVGAARIPHDELERELRKELAVALFARRILSAAKARKLAKLTVWQFSQLLSEHELETDYDEAELTEDLSYVHRDS